MNDLDTRLHGAGRAIREDAERSADVDAGWADLTARLRVDGDQTVVVGGSDRFDRPPASAHRWLAAAAAILVILGAVGTFVALTDPADDPTAAGGPLFLLPAPGSGYETSSGWVESTADVERRVADARAAARSEVVVLGQPDGNGFIDLVSIWTAPTPSDDDDPGPATVEDLTTAVGPATLYSYAQAFERVVQDRGGTRISIDVAFGSAELAIAVLEATTIADGRTEFATMPAGLAEIDRSLALTPLAADDVWPTTTFNARGHRIGAADPDGAAYVEVASWPQSLLAGSPLVGQRIERIDLGLTDAWHATRPDGWEGLVWRAEGGQMVAVSGHEGFEDLLRLAESLVPVDEATWRAATGAGPAATPTGTTSQP